MQGEVPPLAAGRADHDRGPFVCLPLCRTTSGRARDEDNHTFSLLRYYRRALGEHGDGDYVVPATYGNDDGLKHDEGDNGVGDDGDDDDDDEWVDKRRRREGRE